MRWYNMKCVNYKYGSDILPAGTMVKKVGTGSDSQTRKPYITFQTVYDNRVYKIYFVKNWHPGKSASDYKNFMITTKSFDELIQGMTDQEIQAIKRGTVLIHGYSGSPADLNPLANALVADRDVESLIYVCLPGDGSDEMPAFDSSAFVQCFDHPW